MCNKYERKSRPLITNSSARPRDIMYTWARLLEFSRKSQQNIRHALHANVLFPRYKNFSRSLGRAMLEMRQHVQKTQIDVAQGRCPSPSFSLSAKKNLI